MSDWKRRKTNDKMKYGIVKKSAVTIWGSTFETKMVDGQLHSDIADEALYGMGLEITGEAQNGFYPVRTHYGYAGYVREDGVRSVTLEELQAWEVSQLMTVSGSCVDVVSVPRVQGVIYASFYRGALLKVLEYDSGSPSQEEQDSPGADGWAKVELVDGEIGYIRNQYLSEKKYSQAGLWRQTLPQSFLELYEKEAPKKMEEEFRNNVVNTAMKYLGVQYRWGGKSSMGIDCSGLTSISYMLNGVLIYRDARIEEGFPVHEIPREQMKKGDLLYFPGHIAMYIGENRYIHSTGRVGSGGVVINSLDPLDPDFREDLVKSLYAVGSIF